MPTSSHRLRDIDVLIGEVNRLRSVLDTCAGVLPHVADQGSDEIKVSVTALMESIHNVRE